MWITPVYQTVTRCYKIVYVNQIQVMLYKFSLAHQEKGNLAFIAIFFEKIRQKVENSPLLLGKLMVG